MKSIIYSIWRLMPIPLRHNTKKFLFGRFGYLFYKSEAYLQWREQKSPVIATSLSQKKPFEQNSPFATPSTDKNITYHVKKLRPSYKTKTETKIICFYSQQLYYTLNKEPYRKTHSIDRTNDHPKKLGNSDLRDSDTYQQQVDLAKLYGIEGFCFYYYWTDETPLLRLPLDTYVNDPSIKMPFCLCWTTQTFPQDRDHAAAKETKPYPLNDLTFIKSISIYLKDSSYIKVDGRPLLLVHRPDLHVNMKETTEQWRTWCRNNGIGEIYLAYPLPCLPSDTHDAVHPSYYGLDAVIDFTSPSPAVVETCTDSADEGLPLPDGHLPYPLTTFTHPKSEKTVSLQEQNLTTFFRGVLSGCDDSSMARNGTTLDYGAPHRYHENLFNALQDTKSRFPEDNRLVFVNAWNEWGSGAYLEPNQHYGYAYLEATIMAHARLSYKDTPENNTLAIVIHAFYPDVLQEMLHDISKINRSKKLYVTTPFDKEDTIRDILDLSGIEYFLLAVENKGRDVLPFLKIIPYVYAAEHFCVLKLHTKKSLHLAKGEDWRRDIMHKLLSPQNVETAYLLFKENEDIGIIGPAGHLVPMETNWKSNAQTVIDLSQRMGISKEKISTLSFFAGTMFYFKLSSLAPLLNLSFYDEDFEDERGQLDGTLAHAIERLIGVSLFSAGMRLDSIGGGNSESDVSNFIKGKNSLRKQ